MRSIMISFSVLSMLFSQELLASPKTDSIKTFLGGADAKFVWARWAWCSEDYTPMNRTTAWNAGWSLVLLDTRAGTERTLTTGLRDPFLIRVSRSGKWVTFVEGNDGAGNTTYIVDLTSSSPTKRTLMSKSSYSYFAVGAWGIDPANGDEYVYCLDNVTFAKGVNVHGNGIYKVKINSDGTADHNSKQKLTINGSTSGIEVMMAVSGDGKKLASAFPWPDVKILDIASGNLTTRHAGGFGCQTNLAPDNSYRLFHCDGDHYAVAMFSSDLSNSTPWYVDFRKNGPPTSSNANFLEPRWTNHVQYYTATFPMDGDGGAYLNNAWLYMNFDEWGSGPASSAAAVKTMSMAGIMQFYVGKFSADFKTQEKSLLIASDPRYFQGRGEGWICNGTTYGNQCGTSSISRAIRGDRLPELSVVQDGAFVNITTDGAAAVRVADSRGRVVRQATGNGSVAVDIRDLATGAYRVSARQHSSCLTRQVMITR